MSDYPNYFINGGNNIRKVGEALTGFINLYSNVLEDQYLPEPAPPYVRELMGDYTIPSMYLRLPVNDAPVSPVNMTKKPYHVARVINDMHSQLMGMLRNVSYESREPEATYQAIATSGAGKTQIAANYDALAQDTRDIQAGLLTETRAHEADPQFAVLMAHIYAASKIGAGNTLQFKMKHVTTGQEITVQVPNDLIPVPPTIHTGASTSFTDGIPLAAIAWALDKASKGKIMASDAGMFIRYFAGTQAGLTNSISALMQRLQKALPPGQFITDYLVMDGPKLSKTVIEEAHHLQVMRMMMKIQGLPTESVDAIMKPAGVDPEKVTLCTEHAARDVACLLYSTVRTFKEYEAFAEHIPATGVLGEVKRRVASTNGRSTGLSDMVVKLRSLADEIGAMHSQPDMMRKLEDPATLKLLSDAAERAIMCETNIKLKNPDTGKLIELHYSDGLQLIARDILPDHLIIPAEQSVRVSVKATPGERGA